MDIFISCVQVREEKSKDGKTFPGIRREFGLLELLGPFRTLEYARKSCPRQDYGRNESANQGSGSEPTYSSV